MDIATLIFPPGVIIVVRSINEDTRLRHHVAILIVEALRRLQNCKLLPSLGNLFLKLNIIVAAVSHVAQDLVLYLQEIACRQFIIDFTL